MDGIKVYTIVMITLGFTISVMQHGKPKEGRENFFIYLVALSLSIPIYGRILGWW